MTTLTFNEKYRQRTKLLAIEIIRLCAKFPIQLKNDAIEILKVLAKYKKTLKAKINY